jgi:hypothetical protein
MTFSNEWEACPNAIWSSLAQWKNHEIEEPIDEIKNPKRKDEDE